MRVVVGGGCDNKRRSELFGLVWWWDAGDVLVDKTLILWVKNRSKVLVSGVERADDRIIMMQAYLDDKSFGLDGSGPSLGHLVELVRERCQAEGRILVEVRLNDEPIAPEEFSMPLGDSMTSADTTGGAVDELRMYSADPFELVLETTAQAAETLGGMVDLQCEVADLIQTGHTTEALPQLLEVMKTWQQIQECVDDGAALVGISIDGWRKSDSGIEDSIQALTKQLTEIRTALNNQDWVMLSDCLAYEMGPVTEQWRHLLELFTVQVEARQTARRAP